MAAIRPVNKYPEIRFPKIKMIYVFYWTNIYIAMQGDSKYNSLWPNKLAPFLTLLHKQTALQ